MKILNICISGFTEQRGMRTGMRILHEKFIEAGQDSALMEWNDHWPTAARLVGKRPTNIFAYSWGCGWGAMEFLKHYKGKSETLVACDPIYRHPNFWMRITAALRSNTIEVPEGKVGRVIVYVQENSPLLRGDPMSQQDEVHTLDSTHVRIDNHEVFQSRCLEIALGA